MQIDLRTCKIRRPEGELPPAFRSRLQSTAPSYPLASESPRIRLRFTRIR
jgi:hypothetical protein